MVTTTLDDSRVSKLLLTTDEAARVLSISQRTLWKLTKTRQIPCLRIGRSVRYDPQDLLEWIGRHKGYGDPDEFSAVSLQK